ncbi:SirB2 family protein [Acidihalobacter prosperus]
MYWLLKLHIATVLLSLAGFLTRGVWMLRGSSLLRARWVRVTPHIVDTLLLASGIGLVFTLHLYPTQQPWLMAKIVALVLYIVLGTIALKRGRTRGVRAGAWIAALAVFFYILAVAFTKQVVPL